MPMRPSWSPSTTRRTTGTASPKWTLPWTIKRAAEPRGPAALFVRDPRSRVSAVARKPVRGYTGAMARPRGTGKPPELKYKGWQVRLPPELLDRFQQQVPPGERAKLIRRLLEGELQQREREVIGER